MLRFGVEAEKGSLAAGSAGCLEHEDAKRHEAYEARRSRSAKEGVSVEMIAFAHDMAA